MKSNYQVSNKQFPRLWEAVIYVRTGNGTWPISARIHLGFFTTPQKASLYVERFNTSGRERHIAKVEDAKICVDPVYGEIPSSILPDPPATATETDYYRMGEMLSRTSTKFLTFDGDDFRALWVPVPDGEPVVAIFELDGRFREFGRNDQVEWPTFHGCRKCGARCPNEPRPAGAIDG